MRHVTMQLVRPAVMLVLCGMISLGPVEAQEATVGAVVSQIAGANLYLTAGREQGVRSLDTVLVARSAQGAPQGMLFVVSAARDRSVVTFVDGAFPVTRGDSLFLLVDAAAVRALAASAAGREPIPSGATQTSSRRRPPRTPSAHGRIALDAMGLQSTTRGLGSDPEVRERTFATPAARLNMSIENLPGDFTFNASVRAAGRYSTDDIVDPTQSVRLYQANIERSGGLVQLRLGRFYSPFETYSGYWDGGLLRIGGRGFGVGVAGGFQPERANETFSTELRKLTAFANVRLAGRSAVYSSDLSLHFLKPQTLFRDHTFVGWTQRFHAGPLDVSQRLQVDRDPATARWVITNLRLRTSVRMVRGVRVYVQASRRQSYVMERLDDVIGYRRDQADAGVAFAGRVGSLNLEVTANRLEDSDVTFAYGGAFNLPQTGLLGLGFSTAARYGDLGTVRSLYISPGLTRSFGSVQTRASYQLYRTETLSAQVLTHAGDLSLSFPLAGRMFGSVRGRSQWGSHLTSTALYTSLWMSF